MTLKSTEVKSIMTVSEDNPAIAALRDQPHGSPFRANARRRPSRPSVPAKRQDAMLVLGHADRHTGQERGFQHGLLDAFESSGLSTAMRLQNFPSFVRRQDIARFMARTEIFKQILGVNGSIVECGVFAGAGLMTWHHCSAIFEPYNHSRRIFGFDTFEGFPGLSDEDGQESAHLHVGGLKASDSMQEELNKLIGLHDQNRPLGHIPKAQLIAGDACETIPDFVRDNPHALISLLYLDFDIYAPTKAALEHLYPRVVRGGVVAFDELNCPDFPGETVALMESLDMRRVELKRFPFDPYISYFIKD